MDKPVKIGLVGLGRAGAGMHRRELASRSDHFTIAAVCDIIPERAACHASELGCRQYLRLADLLADPDVELVDIATRSCDHYAHAKAALLAGKDVLLEKPFCQTLAEAQELIALGSQPGGPRLFIRHNRRFEQGFQKVCEIIDSGILGQVYEIRLSRNGYQRRADWQTIIAYGGGQLLNWGPHIIDHALRFCGGQYDILYSEIKRVAAVGDAEDHIKIVFTGVNGRIVDMEISGGVACTTPVYQVYGAKGSLVSEGSELRLRYLDPEIILPPLAADPGTPANASFAPPENLPWLEKTIPAGEDTTAEIWDALYAAYRHGQAFPITLDQAAEVVAVIEQVKQGTIFENMGKEE